MIALFIALIVLDALLLWVLTLHRASAWQPKFLAIIAALTVNVAALGAFSSGNGWTTKQLPPRGSKVLYCQAIQPDPVSHFRGIVYVWAVPPGQRPFVGYKSGTGEPRAYRLPYSVRLNVGCIKANKQIAGGAALTVGRPGQKSKGVFRFYKLPPPVLQRKEVHQ